MKIFFSLRSSGSALPYTRVDQVLDICILVLLVALIVLPIYCIVTLQSSPPDSAVIPDLTIINGVSRTVDWHPGAYVYGMISFAGVLAMVLGLWGARHPDSVQLPVRIRPQHAVRQKYLKVRYLRITIVLCGIMLLFLIFRIRCGEVGCSSSWAAAGYSLSFVGMLASCMLATIHVGRAGR